MTTSPSAVVIVNNPTQLLFAIEAADSLALRCQDLQVVMVPTPGARDEDLNQALFRAGGIRRVEKLDVKSLSRVGRVYDSIRLRKAIDPAVTIISPMINYLPARVLMNRAGSNAVITDDGSWTLHFAQKRQNGDSEFRTPLHALVPFGRLPTELTFFTIYELLIAGRVDTVVPNRLDWTKRTFFRGRRGSHIAILGSDLARAGYIDESTLRRHVALLRESHDGPAEYWPHRRESLELAGSMCQQFGMSLRERTLPLEAEIMAVDPSPAVIGTLPSTATKTLRLLQAAVGYRIVVSIPTKSDIVPSQLSLFEAVSSTAKSDADECL